MKNFYEILGIPVDATEAQIKKSYRQLSKKYHPDLSPGDKAAEAKFKEISLAYNTLSNETLRNEYDEKLRGFAQRTGQATKKPSYSNYQAGNFGAEANFDLNNIHKHFENFFGFDPVTKEKKANFADGSKGAKDKNPLDTSHVFEGFFNMKRNKK